MLPVKAWWSKKKEVMTHYVYKIASDGVKEVILEGTMAQCLEFCQFYNWELMDEHEFVWLLEIE